jgi:hypothetical protein
MEILLAQKLLDMDVNQLMQLLMQLRQQDRDAFQQLTELVEDS